MHKIEQLQINNTYTTTVEVTGLDDAEEVVLFSHGFGVGRDARGMFTELVSRLSDRFLCVQFDYARSNENETWVDSYQDMLWTLMKVIEYVKDNYQPVSVHVVGHSMGCLLAASQSVQFHKQVYLAPADEPIAERLLAYFRQNPNTTIDKDGNVTAGRSDGSLTHISKRFFDELAPVIPMDQYAMTNGEIVVVEAQDDEVITNHSETWEVLGNFSLVSIPGDHDFNPPHRDRLVKTVVDYLREQ